MPDMIAQKEVFASLEKEVRESLSSYVELLFEFNRHVNVMSRKISEDQVLKLLKESLLLNKFILNNVIIDAGSGNGLIGIPLAILNSSKQVVLVETKTRKTDFLLQVKERVSLSNLIIKNGSIQDFLRKRTFKNVSLAARGFPEIQILIKLLEQNMVDELILITSKNKIKKNKKGLSNIRQKIYNIPSRDNLIICKMENS